MSSSTGNGGRVNEAMDLTDEMYSKPQIGKDDDGVVDTDKKESAVHQVFSRFIRFIIRMASCHVGDTGTIVRAGSKFRGDQKKLTPPPR
jgi:hypothetical protein